MYSIILMAAMSSGTETPSFGAKFGGCWLDSCCPTRYGWVSCHGPVWQAGYGCGCYGGCYGSCYGCHGYYWPLAYGVYPPLLPYGGYGLYPVPPGAGEPGGGSGGMIGPGVGSPLPKPKEEPKLPNPIRTSHENTNTASITVDVPAGAEVFIDGNRMKSTSTRRVFTSPPLEPGQDYYYWVRVVLEEGSRTVEESKKVFVRAGQRAESSFAHLRTDGPALADAAKRTDH